MQRHTAPPEAPAAEALWARALAIFTTDLTAADPVTFDRMAADVETLPPSPVADRLHRIVDTERDRRHQADTGFGYSRPTDTPTAGPLPAGVIGFHLGGRVAA